MEPSNQTPVSGGFQCSQEEDERPVSDESEEHVRRAVVGVRAPELVSDWRCQEITTTTTATHRETSNRSLIQRFFSRSPQLVGCENNLPGSRQ